jgi:hypothetical protein
MNSRLPTGRAGAVPETLQILVLYTDFPAGIRAKQLTDQVEVLAGNHCGTSLQFWKLDSIPNLGPLKEIIAKDASAADALILATSSPVQDDPVISYWLNLLSATNSERLVHGLLVGVCGDEKTKAADLDRVLSAMFLFASRAQLDFVWQKPEIKTTACPAGIADSFQQLVRRKVFAANRRLSLRAPPANASLPRSTHLENECQAAAMSGRSEAGTIA